MEHLANLPSATIRRGTEVTGVTQTEDAVRLSVSDVITRTPDAVSAGYVVAADGARSPLREELGIEMVGPDDMMSGLAVEFRAPLWPVLGDHRYALYTITHPDGAGVLIPLADDVPLRLQSPETELCRPVPRSPLSGHRTTPPPG